MGRRNYEICSFDILLTNLLEVLIMSVKAGLTSFNFKPKMQEDSSATTFIVVNY